MYKNGLKNLMALVRAALFNSCPAISRSIYDTVPKDVILVSLVKYKVTGKLKRIVQPPKSTDDFIYIHSGIKEYLNSRNWLLSRRVYLGSVEDGEQIVDVLDNDVLVGMFNKLSNHGESVRRAWAENMIMPIYGSTPVDSYPNIKDNINALCKMVVNLEHALERSPYYYVVFTYHKEQKGGTVNEISKGIV